jgi:hypothetical protein
MLQPDASPAEWLPELLCAQLGLTRAHADAASDYLVNKLFKRTNLKLLSVRDGDAASWLQLMAKVAAFLGPLCDGDQEELAKELHAEIGAMLDRVRPAPLAAPLPAAP